MRDRPLQPGHASRSQGWGYGRGGGIVIDGRDPKNLINTTVSNNQADRRGGGIAVLKAFEDTLTLVNSTVSGNRANEGGGGIGLLSPYRHIALAARPYTVRLYNVTIAKNTADTDYDNGEGQDGGGIYNDTGRVVYLVNTIIADNKDESRAGGDVAHEYAGTGTWDSGGHNLVWRGSRFTPSELEPQDPRLKPLHYYGGLTHTHALRLRSPAIDTGDNTAFLDALPHADFPLALVRLIGGYERYDQRGHPFDRGVDGNGDGAKTIDIGAVEKQP